MSFVDTLRRALGYDTEQNIARRKYVAEINREPAFTQEQINRITGRESTTDKTVDPRKKTTFFDYLKEPAQDDSVTEPAAVGKRSSTTKKETKKTTDPRKKTSFFDFLQKSISGEFKEESTTENKSSDSKTETKKETDPRKKTTFFDFLQKPVSEEEAEEVVEPEVKEEVKEEVTPEETEEKIEYTYKPGDTFGQVLLNLGLSDGTNLWGPGGDVEYYTQQLIAQNMLDQRGNVKLGIPFYLTRRK